MSCGLVLGLREETVPALKVFSGIYTLVSKQYGANWAVYLGHESRSCFLEESRQSSGRGCLELLLSTSE